MKPIDFFRKALVWLLEQRGLTQKGLGEKVSISPVEINSFINSHKNFSVDRMEFIAEALESSYVDMLILGRKLAEQGEYPLTPPDNVKPLPHAEIISKFRDPETARKINEMLVEIEARDQDIYRKIEGYIEAKHEEIKDKSVKKISGNGKEG